MNKLIKFEHTLGIKFKKKDLLIKALTHKSSNHINNNEKLEFLGDRVIGLVLSKKILELYPNEPEGDLDKRFAFLVNRSTCLKIGKKLSLNQFVILGKSYRRKKVEDKIVADACEALIGAIYLDLGFKSVENFILKNWKNEINQTTITKIDPKTKLQEYSLKKYKLLPRYELVNSSGPKHKPLYKVTVKISDSKKFMGKGKSIKIAEQDAAKSLLRSIGI